MPKTPKPPSQLRVKPGASTQVRVQADKNAQDQVLLYEDYIQLKIEGIDFSSLELDRKTLTTDIAVDMVAFEAPSKKANKPKQRKYSWWETHPLFPPGSQVDLLTTWSTLFAPRLEKIWLSGFLVADPDKRKIAQPTLTSRLCSEGDKPVPVCSDLTIGRVVFYPESDVRLSVPGTIHYTHLFRSR